MAYKWGEGKGIPGPPSNVPEVNVSLVLIRSGTETYPALLQTFNYHFLVFVSVHHCNLKSMQSLTKSATFELLDDYL